MIRASIRGLLRILDAPLAAELRRVLKRDDDYAAAGKPACDWEDKDAREALVDALARDAYAVLAYHDGKQLADDVKEAATLVATVVGQDLEQTAGGLFRIARRVAPERVISTVDPEARHGHKTSARGFDGYKGHIAIDPDTEIITAAVVTAAHVGDGSVAQELLEEILPTPAPREHSAGPCEKTAVVEASTAAMGQAMGTPTAALKGAPVEVYGDASYGAAEVLEHLETAGAVVNVKVQPPSPPREGLFSQDAFDIDTNAGTVRCPQDMLVTLRRSKDGTGRADFAPHCGTCPQRAKCTMSPSGRRIEIHPQYERLRRARIHQRDAAWKRDYRATRPKVERKLAHLMRRRHGGRRARMRGTERIGQDFLLLCAAANMHRLARLGLHFIDGHAVVAKA